MKTLAALLMLAAIPRLAPGEEVWRWTDAKGTLWYSNRTDVAPPEATPVESRLIIEADRLPGAPDLVGDRAMVIDAVAGRREGRAPHKRPRPIYTEERRRFACYASDILFSGGWSHPDDITVLGNCLPYLLGLEAWLNAARVELALREHALDSRTIARWYSAAGGPKMPRRVATESDVR